MLLVDENGMEDLEAEILANRAKISFDREEREEDETTKCSVAITTGTARFAEFADVESMANPGGSVAASDSISNVLGRASVTTSQRRQLALLSEQLAEEKEKRR